MQRAAAMSVERTAPPRGAVRSALANSQKNDLASRGFWSRGGLSEFTMGLFFDAEPATKVPSMRNFRTGAL